MRAALVGLGLLLGTASVSAQQAAPECATLTDQAMAADLKAASAQAQKQAAAQLAPMLDASVALWTDAAARCEGRAQERARRNLADAQRSRQSLQAELGSGPECNRSHKDAQSLADLAQQAIRERRWHDAASLYRKAETHWDVATERCGGALLQQATVKRDQAAVDAHNAEFCAPVFERARDEAQNFRRLSPTLSSADRQTLSQAVETLWRGAQNSCKAQARDLAVTHAQTLAKERGTPWVATEVPAALAASKAPAPGVMAKLDQAAGTAVTSAGAAVKSTANMATTAAHAVGAAATSATAAITSIASSAASRITVTPSAGQVALSKAADDQAAQIPVVPSVPIDLDIQSGGMRFTGKFIQDGPLLTGEGKVSWPNGDLYQGQLVKNKRHGHGELIWANGQRYRGAWVDDAPQGKGAMRFANGDQYDGELVAGEPQGKGKMQFASGDSFDGQFSRGNPAGLGVYRWASGQTYEGPWQGGPEGRGKMVFANGNRYDGDLRRGLPDGEGKLVYVSGDVYEGSFKQGVPHGQGRFQWKSGDAYQGDWHEGRKHGLGRFEWSNGDAWEGRFDNDAQTAEGKQAARKAS